MFNVASLENALYIDFGLLYPVSLTWAFSLLSAVRSEGLLGLVYNSFNRSSVSPVGEITEVLKSQSCLGAGLPAYGALEDGALEDGALEDGALEDGALRDWSSNDKIVTLSLSHKILIEIGNVAIRRS